MTAEPARRPYATCRGRSRLALARLLVACSVAAALASCANPQQRAASGLPESAGPRWGAPARGVLLDVQPEEPVAPPGVPRQLLYRLRNDGSEAVLFAVPFVVFIGQPGWSGGRIGLLAPDGSRVVPVRAGPVQEGAIRVEPGGSHEGSIDLIQYFDLDQEGAYRGMLFLRVHPASDRSGKAGFEVASGEFRFAVAAPKVSAPTAGGSGGAAAPQ
jgi:hypothetical protein